MNSMMLTHENSVEPSKSGTAGLRLLAYIQIAGSVVGVGGGVVSSIAGSLLTAAGWIATNETVKGWLSSAGSVVLLLVIPLIIFGACCLDWLEKGQRTER